MVCSQQHRADRQVAQCNIYCCWISYKRVYPPVISTDSSLVSMINPICPEGYVGTVVYAYFTTGKVPLQVLSTLRMKSKYCHWHSPWVDKVPPVMIRTK